MAKVYLATLLGIWIGVAISIVLVRHVTIPPTPWIIAGKFCGLAGLIMTPVMLFLVWLAPQTWPKVTR